MQESYGQNDTSSDGSSSDDDDISREQPNISISVTTDNDEYQVGETVKISGKVSGLQNEESLDEVSITITDPSEGVFEDYERKIGLGGEFEDSIEDIGGNLGEYTVHASYGDEADEKTFELNERSTRSSISVTTNKPIYRLGETIEKTGQLVVGRAYDGVDIELFDPNGNNEILGSVETDNGGFFGYTIGEDEIGGGSR